MVNSLCRLNGALARRECTVILIKTCDIHFQNFGTKENGELDTQAL